MVEADRLGMGFAWPANSISLRREAKSMQVSLMTYGRCSDRGIVQIQIQHLLYPSGFFFTWNSEKRTCLMNWE